MPEQDREPCPICGPTLMIEVNGVRECIRHGNQDDINDDPDYARWHTQPLADDADDE